MQRPALIAALAALLTAMPAAAASETYTIDPMHTFPSFEILHFGYSLQRGRFNQTRGKVTVDAAARTGSVDVTIDAASIDTGLAKLEEHLRSDEFLKVAQHPTITFRGATMTFDGDKVKSVAGELTMLGIGRPVTLNAERFSCAPHPMAKKMACGGEFVASIKRSEWGIKAYIPLLADEMLLRINVEAFKD